MLKIESSLVLEGQGGGSLQGGRGLQGLSSLTSNTTTCLPLVPEISAMSGFFLQMKDNNGLRIRSKQIKDLKLETRKKFFFFFYFSNFLSSLSFLLNA